MMKSPPTTRASLIARLSDPEDAAAWDEFVGLYLPLLYRLARARGLQHADAEELAQDALVAVSRAAHRWRPDPELGRFRDWLTRIARNLIVNYLTRARHKPLGAGGSDIVRMLHAHPDPASEESQHFDLEQRREAFRWAAAKVEGEVTENTWQAFWRTSVDGQSPAGVAKALGMTVGAVYIARSRVMARLREQVMRLEEGNTRTRDP